MRQKILSDSPRLVVSGHIHEAQGKEELGKTTIVNPGPAMRGNYCRIGIGENSLRVTFEVLG